MEDHCRGCCERDQKIYWSLFQVVSFYQVLTGFYYRILAFPPIFAKYFKEKLSETVLLKSPKGITWEVGLTTDEDNLYFQRGWKEFVTENFLEENDVLVFKYNGNSQFDVVMFSGGTKCEKECSYFINKCEHREVATTGGRNQKSPVTLQATDGCARDVFAHAPLKKRREYYLTTSMPVEQSTPANNNIHEPDGSTQPSSGNILVGSSSRRPEMEEDSVAALRMAREAALEGSFIKVMMPSHVERGFYMSIPAAWVRSYIAHKIRFFMLAVGKRTWEIKLYVRGRNFALMGRYWRTFVMDNYLGVSDVCLFNLVNRTADDIFLDVKIFRAAEVVYRPPRRTLTTCLGKRPRTKRSGTGNKGNKRNKSIVG